MCGIICTQMDIVDIILRVTPYARFVPKDTIIQVNEHVLTIGPNGVKQFVGCPKYMIEVDGEPESVAGGLRDGTIRVYCGSTRISTYLLSVFAPS